MTILNVMLDLETMGTRVGCAIASLGAVEFDPMTGEPGKEFYQTVDLESCQAAGLHLDAGTVVWWLGQSEEARQALLKDPRPLGQVLVDFRAWLPTKSLLWGHGADFDPPILVECYRVMGFKQPWERRNVRDTRTVLAQASMEMGKHEGLHHALEDAKYQAKRIAEAHRKLAVR